MLQLMYSNTKIKINLISSRGAVSQPGYYDLKGNKNLEELVSSIQSLSMYILG